MAQFVLNFRGMGNSFSDFSAQELAVAMAETADGRVSGGFGNAKFHRDLGAGRYVSFGSEEGLEKFKTIGLTGGCEFRAEEREDGLKNRFSPATLEEGFRCGIVGWFKAG